MPVNVQPVLLEQRKEIVKRLFAQGLFSREIAEALSKSGHTVTDRQIRRYIEEIRADIIKEIQDTGTPSHKVLASFLNDYSEVYREAWKLYRNAQDDRTKAQALKIVAETRLNVVKVLQSMGIIKNEAPQQAGEIIVRWKNENEP